MKVEINAGDDLSKALAVSIFRGVLREPPEMKLSVSDRVSLGLFLNSFCKEELRDVAYGLDDETAKSLIEALKFYGKA